MPEWHQSERATHGEWIERLQIDLPPVLRGTNGPDRITGTGEAEVIYGYRGADTLIGGGGEGRDTIFGGAGADSIVANGGRALVYAGTRLPVPPDARPAAVYRYRDVPGRAVAGPEIRE